MYDQGDLLQEILLDGELLLVNPFIVVILIVLRPRLCGDVGSCNWQEPAPWSIAGLQERSRHPSPDPNGERASHGESVDLFLVSTFRLKAKRGTY